jgi:uncharacterized protein (TIGR02266 family)
MGDEDRGDDGTRSQASPGSERRSSARVPVEMWVEDITDGGLVYRRAANLSRGGLHLDQTIPLPLGSRVKLRFTLPGEPAPLTVTGQIVSISAQDKLGMGLKFVDVDPAIAARIGAYLARSGGA